MAAMLTGRFSHALSRPAIELLPLEPLARAVLLDHHVRDLVDPLVAGEAPAAVEALAPAADDLAFLALARVDDLIAEMSRRMGTSSACRPSPSSRAELARSLRRPTLRPSWAMNTMPTSTTGTNEIGVRHDRGSHRLIVRRRRRTWSRRCDRPRESCRRRRASAPRRQ